MSGLFGRGGKQTDPSDSEPSVLDIRGDKSEITKKLLNPEPEKSIGPSSNDISDQDNDQSGAYNLSMQKTMASSYQSTGPTTKASTDIVKDYSDMQVADSLKDNDIASLRKDGYKLSNLEKEFEIRNRNDFNNIIKIVLICFSMFVGIGFFIIIGIIAWTSYKTNTVTETGIISNFLQFIAEIIKIGLS